MKTVLTELSSIGASPAAFPKSHDIPRVDDRRILSGIIFMNRNGLRWRDTPAEYDSHETLGNPWKSEATRAYSRGS